MGSRQNRERALELIALRAEVAEKDKRITALEADLAAARAEAVEVCCPDCSGQGHHGTDWHGNMLWCTTCRHRGHVPAKRWRAGK